MTKETVSYFQINKIRTMKKDLIGLKKSGSKKQEEDFCFTKDEEAEIKKKINSLSKTERVCQEPKETTLDSLKGAVEKNKKRKRIRVISVEEET